MYALFTNLMAAALVVHAMIGCCHHHWHHADETATTSVFAASVCRCCSHSDSVEDDCSAPGEPCSGELECQGVCSYLPPQKAGIDDSIDVLSFDQLALLDIHAACPVACNGLAATISDGRCTSPPLPTLHHLGQLLLI